MREAEKVIVGGLLSALAMIVPGVLFHSAPRFPGSLMGGLIGIAAASLFVLLLVYSAVKQVPSIRRWTNERISTSAVLSFHVYAGTVGALLGIIHSGHRFHSPLGIALTVAMLTVVASGFVGRYYFTQVALDLHDQQKNLRLLRDRYDTLVGVGAGLQHQTVVDPSGLPVRDLLGAISDLEFSIVANEAIKRAFARWIVLHIVSAIVMYALLALHVWSSVYYGLRWLQ